MVRVNTLSLFYGLVIYCIKAVSSNELEIHRIGELGYKIVSVTHEGVTRFLIYPLIERPVRLVRESRTVIWMGHPDESLRCLTIITFSWSLRALLSIEVNNPVNNDVFFLMKNINWYSNLTREEFENEYQTFVNIGKEHLEKTGGVIIPELPFILPQKIPKPKQKKPKKRKFPFEKDDTEDPTKKKTLTHTELEPETIPVEVESDEEEIDVVNVSNTKESDE